ncbi:hypothetical protein EDC04DRAFT_860841 [Pisolithus marmoratus]|nr:hypothetical protein EDC04DRAFT_860841 [Pisolithus marmoratus]
MDRWMWVSLTMEVVLILPILCMINIIHVVEQGIGCILVFEYSYFLMEVEDEQNVQRSITAAVKHYQASGTQSNVMKLIHKAFEDHGEDVETLCPILVDIVKDNQIKAPYKLLNRKQQSLAFEALAPS